MHRYIDKEIQAFIIIICIWQNVLLVQIHFGNWPTKVKVSCFILYYSMMCDSFFFSCLFCFLNEKKKLCWVCYTFKRYIDVYDTFYCEFCSSIKIHKKKMSAYSQKFHQWSFSYFVPIYYVYNIVVCKIRTIFNKYLLSTILHTKVFNFFDVWYDNLYCFINFTASHK